MIFRARLACTPHRPPIENAALEVRDGRVVSLSSARAPVGAHETDLGDVLLLPGLINAHTHLELTRFRGRVPFHGCFAEWIEELLRLASRNQDDDAKRESTRAGIAQSLRSGVTTVADIGYGTHQIQELSRVPLRAVCFQEFLGMGPKCHTALKRLAEFDRRIESAPPGCWPGFSPHAPYSTHERIYREVVRLAEDNDRRVCTHLAETREEEQFLLDGSGPLRELLERRGLIDESFSPAGCTPIEFADRVGLLDTQTLLIHVNYLDPSALDRLAGSGCSVAFCPRTHRFFGHHDHRFATMMAMGINLCLGTDGLASNDSLSILDEWRFLHALHPDLGFSTLLCMSTANAAKALRISKYVGALTPGRFADFITLPAQASSAERACLQVIESSAVPRAVYIGGQCVFQK